MDEILSSIRQIIADDDEAATSTKPVRRSLEEVKPVAPAEARKSDQVIDPFEDDEDEAEPLALSNDQIVEDPETASAQPMDDDWPTPASAASGAKLEPVAPTAEARKPMAGSASQGDDQVGPMARAVADKARAEAPAAKAPESREEPEAAKPASAAPEAEDEPSLVVPDDIAFEQDEDVARRPDLSRRPSVADAAPLPDSRLSSDLAEELLGPATEAAVRSALSKVQSPKSRPDMALGASNLTIEAMIREMLRPMLKEWLEENLPSMVERIVVQEIERVSRGGR
ncbi:DUF2497 domain-containing protein [Pelagibacterium montanilacus]|uniref:DUF2497 domain-containing protein n=1 Tax=Pelagibacterium montanilacus TaxID=2185280 RepID=UPI0013E0A01E|nr:DUF2497 domain-containing protein [Pelagibacterium montanilacus]